MPVQESAITRILKIVDTFLDSSEASRTGALTELERALLFAASGLMAHFATAMGEDLNRRLELLLKAFLLDDQRLFDERGGPLGTFSSRREMAGALGLISTDERHDLSLIRKIRNHSAHGPFSEALFFDDEKIKARCARLKTPKQFDDELFAPINLSPVSQQILSPRSKISESAASQFYKAYGVLAVALIARKKEAVRVQKPAPLNETQIQAALSEFRSEAVAPSIQEKE